MSDRAANETPNDRERSEEPGGRDDKASHGDVRARPEYLTLATGFAVALAGFWGYMRCSGRKIPGGVSLGDVLLTGVATHKLSRLLSKNKITSPLRAPFVKDECRTGSAEVEGQPRGEGMQKIVGELISCPYCLDVWVGTSLGCGMVVKPRLTRFVCGILSSITTSDFLHQAYCIMKATNERA
jgi:hypothetical protein